MDNHIETRVGEHSVDGALFFYFNEATGDLVYSDKATYSGDGYTSLGQQTNMNPSSPSAWVFHSQRSAIATVSKDESVGGKIAGLTNMSSMFNSCSNLTKLDLSGLDTSSVTSMNNMFNACSVLTSLDLSGLDTSSVTDMSYMFRNCGSLTSLDLSGLDTSSVTGMGGMFSDCGSLTNLDLSGFNTSSVTRMGDMFSDCGSLTNLDLSGFDTSSATGMSTMFYRCGSLTNLDLSGFDTSSVTSMYRMFYGCSSLTSLDLSSFNTSSVTNMSHMFLSCSSLISLDLSGFDTSAVTNMVSMFYSCSSLRIIDISPNMSDVLSALPADTYYDAITRQSYTKDTIPGGSTYVRDLADLDLVATMVQTRMGINKVKGMLNEVRDLKKQVDASLQQIQSLQDSLSQITYIKTINSNSRVGFEWVRDDVLYLYVVVDGQRAIRFTADFPS